MPDATEHHAIAPPDCPAAPTPPAPEPERPLTRHEQIWQNTQRYKILAVVNTSHPRRMTSVEVTEALQPEHSIPSTAVSSALSSAFFAGVLSRDPIAGRHGARPVYEYWTDQRLPDVYGMCETISIAERARLKDTPKPTPQPPEGKAPEQASLKIDAPASAPAPASGTVHQIGTAPFNVLCTTKSGNEYNIALDDAPDVVAILRRFLAR